MAQPRFSLSWNAHSSNISNGLSALQQNSEFVDMTLAADGHFVKVHQVIMAVASPYIKELISSAQCPHPVIFLNKISYTTLQAILEYIYTGEVFVAQTDLSDLMEAAKELHIKGLQDMKLELTEDISSSVPKKMQSTTVNSLSTKMVNRNDTFDEDNPDMQEVYLDNSLENDSNMDTDHENKLEEPNPSNQQKGARLQYTLSNQGSVQLILNRYIYTLRYTSVRSSGHRTWRCVDYECGTKRCPASAVTSNDVVVKRFSAHNHGFHDQRIMKKLRDSVIFTALNEAELSVKTMKAKKRSKHVKAVKQIDK